MFVCSLGLLFLSVNKITRAAYLVKWEFFISDITKTNNKKLENLHFSGTQIRKTTALTEYQSEPSFRRFILFRNVNQSMKPLFLRTLTMLLASSVPSMILLCCLESPMFMISTVPSPNSLSSISSTGLLDLSPMQMHP